MSLHTSGAVKFSKPVRVRLEDQTRWPPILCGTGTKVWMAFALLILYVFVHVFMNLLLVGEGVCGKNAKKVKINGKLKGIFLQLNTFH